MNELQGVKSYFQIEIQSASVTRSRHSGGPNGGVNCRNAWLS
jgi:hypothetical protein